MIVFLASSPTREINAEHPWPMLDERNGFVEQLKRVWPAAARCLMIAAAPDDRGLNDEMTAHYREASVRSGLPVACFDLWDARHPGLSGEQFQAYDVIFLAGGHLPTEWAWFQSIGLKHLLRDFGGIVIGTSAGSMNAAELVYAWPELPGETEDPDYALFFKGLGLAKTQILPHYQKVKDQQVDGKRYVQEIACSHSYGSGFLALPDGSYVLARNGVETVYGEAHLVSDGQISLFCQEGGSRVFLRG